MRHSLNSMRAEPPFPSRHFSAPGYPGAKAAFTLIELMVVVAILVLAMGMMIPSLVEFFANQRLKNVRSHFVSAINVARLMAITEGSPIRVVFFKEGVRVYNVRRQSFRREEEFDPDAAPGSVTGITFEVQFARKMNQDLPPYREWEREQPFLLAPPADQNSGQCSVDGIASVEFQRDGTVRWLSGEDVPTALYNRDPASGADIVVRQVGNPEALFVDIRATGQVRSKLSSVPPPGALGERYVPIPETEERP